MGVDRVVGEDTRVYSAPVTTTEDAARARPFLKWAGGKRGLADTLTPLFPDLEGRTYREPFLGGGAMFFHLAPKKAVLSDALEHLITTYRVIQKKPRPLLTRLTKLEHQHAKEPEETYYAIRHRFNFEDDAADEERAAWFIYLNRTCYNGLFRTNQSGHFNVPIGRYTNPRVADAERVNAASKALAKVRLIHADFAESLKAAKKNDFVYLDPPYVPLSATSSFAAYDGGFSMRDQEALRDLFAKLDRRGCLLALSNSDTPEVHALYKRKGWEVLRIDAPRSISANGAVRGTAPEVLVRNQACVDAARG